VPESTTNIATGLPPSPFSLENGEGRGGVLVAVTGYNNPMHSRRNSDLACSIARKLRREQTIPETRLWQMLRSHQLENYHFRRQHPIGKYIVDFCAPKARLVIELDGSQHHDMQEYDAERTSYLQALGYRVIRFWNHEVMVNLDGVLAMIMEAINATPSQPPPF